MTTEHPCSQVKVENCHLDASPVNNNNYSDSDVFTFHTTDLIME